MAVQFPKTRRHNNNILTPTQYSCGVPQRSHPASPRPPRDIDRRMFDFRKKHAVVLRHNTTRRAMDIDRAVLIPSQTVLYS